MFHEIKMHTVLILLQKWRQIYFMNSCHMHSLVLCLNIERTNATFATEYIYGHDHVNYLYSYSIYDEPEKMKTDVAMRWLKRTREQDNTYTIELLF